MTKEELLQYGSIKRELADIQKRLSALEKNKGYHGMAYSDTPRQRGEPVPEAQLLLHMPDSYRVLHWISCTYEPQEYVRSRIHYLVPLQRFPLYRSALLSLRRFVRSPGSHLPGFPVPLTEVRCGIQYGVSLHQVQSFLLCMTLEQPARLLLLFS